MATTTAAPGLRMTDWLFVALSVGLIALPWFVGGTLTSDKTWALKLGAMMLGTAPLVALAGMHRPADWFYLVIGAGLALAPLLMALEGATWVEWSLAGVGGLAMLAGAWGIATRKGD